MGYEEFAEMSLTQMQKKRWRTAKRIAYGNQAIGPGVEVQIVGRNPSKGLTIEAPHCPHCLVAFVARDLPPTAVEEIA